MKNRALSLVNSLAFIAMFIGLDGDFHYNLAVALVSMMLCLLFPLIFDSKKDLGDIFYVCGFAIMFLLLKDEDWTSPKLFPSWLRIVFYLGVSAWVFVQFYSLLPRQKKDWRTLPCFSKHEISEVHILSMTSVGCAEFSITSIPQYPHSTVAVCPG